MLKTCSKCQVNKSINNFYKDVSRPDRYSYVCKQCNKLYVQQNKEKIARQRKCYRDKNAKKLKEIKQKYYQENKKTILFLQKIDNKRHAFNVRNYRKNNVEKLKAYHKQRYRSQIIIHLYKSIKARAKRKKILFDISIDDFRLLATERCPILDVEFVIGSHRPNNFSRTIDRLIPKLGYINGNLVMVSHLVNRVKSDSSIEKLKLLVNNLEKIISSKNAWKERFKLELSWQVHKKNDQILKSRFFKHAKKRATDKNIAYEISKDDIVIPSLCPLLRIPIKRGNKKLIPSSPTIDRIDNSLGYTPNNIIVISHRANTMKNDCSLETLKKIYNGYVRIFDARLMKGK